MRRWWIVEMGIGAVLMAVAAVIFLNRAPDAAPMAAAQSTPQAASLPKSLTVVGQGKVSVKPDMAETTLGVRAEADSVAAAQSKVNQDMDNLLKALKQAGIADADIQTTGYNVNPRTTPEGKTSGYEVSNMVRVRIRDLAKVGPTIDAALQAGANQVYGIQFTLADPASAQTQARAAAVNDAKARATELAGEAGVTLGEIVQVSSVITGGPVFDSPMGKGGMVEMAVASAAVQPGELMVTTQVQVVYGLK